MRVAAEVSPVEEIAELTDRMAKQPGGGKAILKLGLWGVGVGEAGEQGRARLGDRFG